MQFRPSHLSKEFKNFKNGDVDALAEILRSERDRLFDYVMRMTGQLIKSADIAEETMNTVEQHADDCDTLEELLVLCYKTARNFAVDVWNADTSKLENSSYAGAQGRENLALVQLESVIRCLPPEQREVLILRERFGFALDEVAEIMVLPVADVEIMFAKALGIVEGNLPEQPSQKIPELLSRLHPFTKQLNDGPETQNLSLIMNDFRKTNRIATSGWGWARFLVFLLLCGAAWHYREEIAVYANSFMTQKP